MFRIAKTWKLFYTHPSTYLILLLIFIAVSPDFQTKTDYVLNNSDKIITFVIGITTIFSTYIRKTNTLESQHEETTNEK